LTAPLHESDAGREVGRVCHVAAEGRRAARALGQWCRHFEITEPEFQVLWCLQDEAGGASDQTTLARRLAYSPAQVSSTVERLRARGWIAQHAIDGDRRRNLWRLSESGGGLVAQILQGAPELQSALLNLADRTTATSPQREAA
jgi:DNA-binding MarR family transcriptional regulator